VGSDEVDDRDLVERAKSGSSFAFAELYHRHVADIYRFCWRRTHDQHLAEDMTAATFERALKGLPSFRWRDGGFAAWLYRIAANQLADHHRRTARQAARDALLAAVPAAVVGDPADTIIRADDDRTVLDALSALRPRYQEVVALRYLAGLSADEAAAAMGMSKSRLAVTLHRALRALERVLEQ
jgi:RNA polymerase sigma-70 factor, ECF subfamily